MGVHDTFYAITRMLAVLSLCPKLKFFISPGIYERLMELYDQKKNEKALEIARRGVEPPRGFFTLLASIAEEKSNRYPNLARGNTTKTTALINELLLLKRKNLKAARELLKLLEEHKPTEELVLESRIGHKEKLLENYEELKKSWELAKRILKCAVKFYELEME